MSFENIVEKANADIEQYGWSTMYVDANRERGMESFSYTIGLEETYDHPEVIVFGLPAETAHNILSAIAHAIKEGESMPLHTPVENILGGDFNVIFKPLASEAYADYLSVAISSYRSAEFRTQIMFWPDKEGYLPTEDSYSIQGQLTALKLISTSEKLDVLCLRDGKKMH